MQYQHTEPTFSNNAVEPFGGNLVVTTRSFKPAVTIRAIEITSQHPNVHGGPIHIGNPSDIGISNLAFPDVCGTAEIPEGEIPVFWACGVKPQEAIMAARIPLAICHAPSHMLVTAIPLDSLATHNLRSAPLQATSP